MEFIFLEGDHGPLTMETTDYGRNWTHHMPKNAKEAMEMNAKQLGITFRNDDQKQYKGSTVVH